MSNHGISINKFISSTGKCSRRQADEWIDWGLVTINGKVAKKGNRVTAKDIVKLDGKVIKQHKKPAPTYLAFNKPKGITCTTDQRDKTNIIDFINYKHRIFPIGRLDKLSTGLILLTNDGDIVNKILRTENNNEKEYIVTVDQPITTTFLKRMSSGVRILNTTTKPCTVEQLKENTFKIILTQGLNRQIRRMCEVLGYKVTALKRIRIMHITLGNLAPGQYRTLTESEFVELNNSIK